MSICPFWSNGNRNFQCYSKCPMHKENTKEECVFSLHLKDNNSKKNEDFMDLDNIDSYIDFKEIEDDIFNDILYIRNY